MPNVIVGSFCSFAPGGSNYNTVSGISTYDEDMNGCTATDSAFRYLMVQSVTVADTDYFYTNNAGYYNAILNTANFTFTPLLQNPTYFSISPTTTNVHFPNNNSNTQTQDYCIEPNGVYPDVEVTYHYHPHNAMPGFNTNYLLLYTNKGTTTASGTIILDFMDNKMNFIGASSPPTTQTANQLIWNYTNLHVFESRWILVDMDILPPPINQLGDTLIFNANIPFPNDVTPSDNNFVYMDIESNACDPNDITCLEGEHLLNTEIGEYLHYSIRFQNTGNAPAQNIVVRDSIDGSKFDISSLQILETSHLSQIQINNDVLEVYFDQIMLPDSFTNEPLSHGDILYKIKTKTSLPFNSYLKNKAEIYFDFNLPVITNTAITTFGNTVGIDIGVQENPFKCYPNPASTILTIEAAKEMDCVILNVLGEAVIKQRISGKVEVDISMLLKGVYWIRSEYMENGHGFVKE